MITSRQVAAIARATKSLHPQSLGNRILVWPDGSHSEACGPNDVTCLLSADGTRTYPLARLSHPMTRREVADTLRAHGGDVA